MSLGKQRRDLRKKYSETIGSMCLKMGCLHRREAIHEPATLLLPLRAWGGPAGSSQDHRRAEPGGPRMLSVLLGSYALLDPCQAPPSPYLVR